MKRPRIGSSAALRRKPPEAGEALRRSLEAQRGTKQGSGGRRLRSAALRRRGLIRLRQGRRSGRKPRLRLESRGGGAVLRGPEKRGA